MQRTAWRGFGDAATDQAFYVDTPLDVPPDAGVPEGIAWPNSLALAPDRTNPADLVAAAAARTAGLVNVDPLTALQSKVSAAVPSDLRLPLILAGAGLLALLLATPSSGRRR